MIVSQKTCRPAKMLEAEIEDVELPTATVGKGHRYKVSLRRSPRTIHCATPSPKRAAEPRLPPERQDGPRLSGADTGRGTDL